MSDLTELYERNRKWRVWMDANTPFKTPDTLDCLRYAVTEIAEAMDVWLRQNNQAHARNNGRNHDLYAELADTAMMLLTALDGMPDDTWPDIAYDSHFADMDGLCQLIIRSIPWYRDEIFYWRCDAYQALHHIANYPGMDLLAELDKRHQELSFKWGKNKLIDWWEGQGATHHMTMLYFAGKGTPLPWRDGESLR